MSQHDMTLDNASGLVFRNDANAALQALASQCSGASAPSPTFPCQVWGDTGTSRLKQRNAANTAWLDKGPLDAPLRDAASQGEFVADTGAVNAYVCNFVPAITARSESTPIRFKAANANTGASTINDGLGVVAIVGGAHSALQGGEIVANGIAWIQWNASIGGGSYVLLFCTGAAEQISPATKSQHAARADRVGVAGGFTFRNIIHNGNFNVNQRAYVSGTATTVANQLTLDRWKVQTSGQSVTFTASGNGNAITAPAGGLAEVIEASNIFGGTYCASWVGAGTITVNGVAVANGASFTLPANTNATVVLIGAFSQFQIEQGSVPTAFENRPVSVELALCQRYAYVVSVTSGQKVLGWGAVLTSTSVAQVTVYLPTNMRSAPSLSNIGGGSASIFSTTTSGAGAPTNITLSGNILTFDTTSVSGNAVGAIAGYILSAGVIFVISSDI